MTLVIEIVVALALVLGLLLAVEVGFRLGLRRREKRERDEHLGTVQSALLGLLALLLGFAFSGAMSRFIDRQDIIVQEANAIGTAFLRADLLPAVDRDALRQRLRTYTETRLEIFRITTVPHSSEPRAESEIEADLARIYASAWSIAVNASRRSPEIALAVLDPLNNVTDLFAVRRAASSRHLPAPVLALLIGAAMISMATLGHGQALNGGQTRTTVVTLALLIAAALLITIDLDFPQLGLIQISPQPLRDAIPIGF